MSQTKRVYFPLWLSTSPRFRRALLLLALLAPMPWAQAADPQHVGVTLEGCRNNGDILLPNERGQFVCPDEAYTTGNLGKGWNELDLVPHRVTLDAKRAAPASQTYTIALVLDYIEAGRRGYDVISIPKLNTALSHPSCSTPTVSGELLAKPGMGGTDQSRYRLMTVTQLRDTQCVYDYYGRLALGSHLFPGSSLHANVALQGSDGKLTSAGIGVRDVSIPVNEILAQELGKTASGTLDASHTWALTKSASPAQVSFGDVCAPPGDPTVKLTVRWEKLPAAPGQLAAVASIFASNPASRSIRVHVTDRLYRNLDQSQLLHTTVLPAVDVPPNTANFLVGTDVVRLDAARLNLKVGDFLNDVAIASYSDPVTGKTIVGQSQATAFLQITQGVRSNVTANITDTASITGAGLSYSVAPTTIGSFEGYTPGTPTSGTVRWSSGTQGDSAAVEFTKTLFYSGSGRPRGALYDQARLVASDGFTIDSRQVKVPIGSGARVSLRLRKRIPDYLDPGESLEVSFHVARLNDPTYSREYTFRFVGGGSLSKSKLFTGLVPDIYVVTETSSVFYPADGSAPRTDTGLNPGAGTQRTVDLRVHEVDGQLVKNCAGTALFVNEFGGQGGLQVQKIAEPDAPVGSPDHLWQFRMTGPGGVEETVWAGANAGFVRFNTPLRAEGLYVVEELTSHPGWDLVTALPNDGERTERCSIQVDFPEDSGKLLSCTFHNVRSGRAGVDKTVLGQPPTGSHQFRFQVRHGASPTSPGVKLSEGLATAANGGQLRFPTALTPGVQYQLCEEVMPGWTTSLSGFVPGGADDSIVCEPFQLEPGQLLVTAVDNRPPPGGEPRTIGFWKNWASCAKSKGRQEPVLDRTLASFPGGRVLIGDAVIDTCLKAVRLLNKSTIDRGKKMASDPAFNLAAQLLAARLNVQAGADSCPAASNAISQAQTLLDRVNFNGKAKPSMSSAQKREANQLATTLDLYNNGRLCP